MELHSRTFCIYYFYILSCFLGATRSIKPITPIRGRYGEVCR